MKFNTSARAGIGILFSIHDRQSNPLSQKTLFDLDLNLNFFAPTCNWIKNMIWYSWSATQKISKSMVLSNVRGRVHFTLFKIEIFLGYKRGPDKKCDEIFVISDPFWNFVKYFKPSQFLQFQAPSELLSKTRVRVFLALLQATKKVIN